MAYTIRHNPARFLSYFIFDFIFFYDHTNWITNRKTIIGIFLQFYLTTSRNIHNKKSNAAIKEQFKQEKRKDKKEREAFFDQKKAEARQRLTPNVNQQSGKKGQAPAPVSHQRKESDELMPLNKYIAHSGVAAAALRRWR